jgi:hypothetical protein
MRNSGVAMSIKGKKGRGMEGKGEKKHTLEYPSEFVLVASHI